MVEHLNKIIRRRDLPDYVGLRLTVIDELIAKGEFPKPISLTDSGRAVGWVEVEVWAWQQQRLVKRAAEGGAK
jgi:predicted DNA-binding transcriptional regulator AlpA